MENRIISKLLWRKLLRHFIWDSSRLSNTVLLAGSGRSGTTWLENIINFENDYRIMFEPFDSTQTKLFSEFLYRQYMRPDAADNKLLITVEKILSGKVRSEWVDKFNKKLIVNKRVVKDIRINLFLKWIKSNFPEVPIIFVLRHPFSVALSKKKLGWESHFDLFLEQEKLMSDHLSPFKSLMENTKDPFLKHVLMWCVENYIPLMQFKRDEIFVLLYEEILSHPRDTIENLFDYIGQEFDQAALNSLSKPSELVSESSAVLLGRELVGTWRDELDMGTIDQGMDILHKFGFDTIYSDKSTPIAKGKDVIDIFQGRQYG